MIEFSSLVHFGFADAVYQDWVVKIAKELDRNINELHFIFCTDDYLLRINKEYLEHDTYTDIITFDYAQGEELHGDIFISIERVKDNARHFKVSFDEELLRVMAHGVLHLCGLKDKSEVEKAIMRREEDRLMKMFHVEQ